MEVYAKSNQEPLDIHIENCLRVFRSAKECFPYFPEVTGEKDFWKHLFLVIAFHDLGKVASGFQHSLEGHRWNYRHEILSAGFAANLPIALDVTRALVLAVSTHHKGIRELIMNYRTYGSNAYVAKERWTNKVEEMRANQDYLKYLIQRVNAWSSEYLGQDINLNLSLVEVKRCKDIFEVLGAFMNSEFSFEDRGYPIALRGLAMGIDHLASAQIPEIRGGFGNITSLLKKSGEISDLRGFQRSASMAKGSAVLCAPTGSGKTAAALLWYNRNITSASRLFYVLPYTASINAMSKRLEQVFGREKVGLVHHRSTYAIYTDFLEQSYSHKDAWAKAKEKVNLTRKIYRPIKVLTPYQIVKPFYGVKGYEILISEMFKGCFVYDEIHVYEPHTTALIVRSAEELKKFGAKFLFMSATLPSFLKELLFGAIGEESLIVPDTLDSHDSGLLSEARRQIYIDDGNILENIDKIEEVVSKTNRILIVCNTVGQAQEVYHHLKKKARSAKLLHGRFITSERERIEKEIANADLLVGTQAIEVSLNFSFDTLFTEPAPVDALLQRFGRVNRFGKPSKLSPVHVFTEGSGIDGSIYKEKRVRKTLHHLPQGAPLSNQEAASLVEEVYGKGYDAEEREEYEKAYENFNRVIESLPFFDESDFKEEFFDLIGAWDMVPIRFKDQFLDLSSRGMHLDAIGYVITINSKQWYRLLREGRVSEIDHDFFVDAKYQDEYGLIIGEREDSATLSNIIG